MKSLSPDELHELLGVEAGQHHDDVTAASGDCHIPDAELDAMCADATRSSSSLVERAAEEAIAQFHVDGVRVRSRALEDGTLVALIITTRDGTSTHAGVEPFSVINGLPADALVHTVNKASHCCWVVRVGVGRLVRTWRRSESGNEDERFFAVKPSGEVKQIDRLRYQTLRRWVPRQAPPPSATATDKNSHAKVSR